MDHVNKIRVLMTGAGAPGAAGIIKCLTQMQNVHLVVQIGKRWNQYQTRIQFIFQFNHILQNCLAMITKGSYFVIK